MLRPLLLATLAIMGLFIASSAQADNRMSWSGEVDDRLEIVIRGRSVTYRNITGDRPRDIDYRFWDGVPARRVRVWLDRRDGRSPINLVESPNRNNGYSVVLRIFDKQAGSARYRFTLRWNDNDNNGGNWGGNDGGDGNHGGGDWNDGNNNDHGGGWDNNVGQNSIRWTGHVDGTNDIRIQRSNVEWRKVDGRGAWDVRYKVGDALPGREINARVDKRRGRGSVYILTQPGRQNNYTLTVRVVDNDPGDDFYDFVVRW